MGKLSNVYNALIGQADNTKQLEQKVSELQAKVEKSLSSTLAGIIGSQWIELDIKKIEDAYKSNYVIYRGINLLAQCIAQLPLVVYKGDNQLDDNFTFVNFDLQNPGIDLSLYELLYRSLVYYFYRGEMFVYIDLSAPKIQLQPLNPQLMELKDGKWKYNKQYIPTEQLIYLPMFDPDGERGMSLIDVIKEELKNDEKAREFNTKYFENFGKVGGLLEPSENAVITKEDMQLTVDQFNKLHAGSKNAHKILGLPPGVTYNESDQSMKDMEFAEGRRDVRDRILGIMGIHKSIFGVTDQVDRAVADAAMRQLWIHTLKPNAIRVQEKLNQHLMNRYFSGYQVYFDFDGVEELSDSNTEILNRAKLMKELGYTMNEINEYYGLGMEPVTDAVGDMRFVPSNLIPASEVENPEPEPVINENLDEKLLKVAELLEEEDKNTINKSIVDKSRASYIRHYDAMQKTGEKKIRGKIRKHFATQLNKVLQILYGSKSVKAIDEVLLMMDVRTLLSKEKEVLTVSITPTYKETAESASTFARKTIGSTAPAVDIDNIVNNMVNRTTRIEDSGYKLIRAQIKEGVAAGETVEQLVDRIKKVYNFETSYAAKRIATTESSNLINRVFDEEYKKAGIKRKVWITMGDDLVRETHTECAKAGAILYDEPFPNHLMFPGDPNGEAAEIVNCRCCLQPVIGE